MKKKKKKGIDGMDIIIANSWEHHRIIQGKLFFRTNPKERKK